MLDELGDFIALIKAERESFRYLPAGFVGGALFCPTCGAERRVSVNPLHVTNEARSHIVEFLNKSKNQLATYDWDLVKLLCPSLFKLECVQCKGLFTAVIYTSASGPAVSILPAMHGGLRTAHTPPGVAYYLDQAQRSRSLSANSAAVAMYRAALEQVLYEQGCTRRMLGNKLKDLEDAIAAGTAPKWARDLETEYLNILKDLGNHSIHPDDGDVTKQAALDGKLLSIIAGVFVHLLFLVYEVPHEKAATLNALRAASSILKK